MCVCIGFNKFLWTYFWFLKIVPSLNSQSLYDRVFDRKKHTRRCPLPTILRPDVGPKSPSAPGVNVLRLVRGHSSKGSLYVFVNGSVRNTDHLSVCLVPKVFPPTT